jgi:hypothetical protein
MKGHPGTSKSTLAKSLSSALIIPLIDVGDVHDCPSPLESSISLLCNPNHRFHSPQRPLLQLHILGRVHPKNKYRLLYNFNQIDKQIYKAIKTNNTYIWLRSGNYFSQREKLLWGSQNQEINYQKKKIKK